MSQGLRGLAPFDVAIFDEAHKTTGPQGGLFAHSLKDENICIRKRLFFTATPRHYDIRHRDKDGDFHINSMDDEAIYGPRAYTLTFGSAARQGIICNYKVVISVVDGQEVNDFALKHGITLVKGELIAARWVANQIAIERATEQTGARHVITFHSRVSSASEFSSSGSHGIKQFLSEFSLSHVNGEQKSSERKQLIRAFRDAPKALITNARCLTEGIDVPAVDMVAFLDPRHSKIDIAQAGGRAMRKPPGSDKEVGYVVIPLFLESKNGETPEEAFGRSDFSDVADVLNAMKEQDEDLVQIIRELREAEGQDEIFDPRQLAEKIEVVGPSIELSALRANIFAEIVDTLGESWDEWYGRLKIYKEREGHCRVPQLYQENGFRLGQWVGVQRLAKARMSAERRERLDKIGFVWDPFEADWEEGFHYLTKYRMRTGHCRVPALYKEDSYPLGGWVRSQRTHEDRLSNERRKRLKDLGFVWDPRDADWEEGLQHLIIYKEREGHCRVPVLHIEDGFPLGRWVGKQRSTNVSEERRERLNDVGFVWDDLDNKWETGFSYLKAYKEREGHCRVPAKHKENGFRLGQWASVQRLNPSLSQGRRQQLSDLGFIWDPHGAGWQEGFQYLEGFVRAHKHCRVPTEYKSEDGYKLGGWVVRQRSNQDTLSTQQKAQLDALGFDWDPQRVLWETGYHHLKIYKDREGHCRVPGDHNENGFSLGLWVNNQAQLKNTMPAERRRKLDEIGFIWDTLETAWNEGFNYLTIYKNREGHCRVPRGHIENGYRLGQWVGVQRLNEFCPY